jgi:hypothetical protein
VALIADEDEELAGDLAGAGCSELALVDSNRCCTASTPPSARRQQTNSCDG